MIWTWVILVGAVLCVLVTIRAYRHNKMKEKP